MSDAHAAQAETAVADIQGLVIQDFIAFSVTKNKNLNIEQRPSEQ